MWHIVNTQLPIKAMGFGYLPSFWNKQYGVLFGKRYLYDPEYRYDILVKVQKWTYERLNDVYLGSMDPFIDFVQPEFVNSTTPMIAGCELFFPDDNFCWNRHLSQEKLEKLQKLEPSENIENILPYSEIINQTKLLSKKLGREIKPIILGRGLLNDSLLIRGDSLLGDMLDEDPMFTRVTEFVYSVYEKALKLNYETQGNKNFLHMPNCAAIMLSPQQYEKYFMPYDMRTYQKSVDYRVDFFLHHCGIIDKYLELYRKFPHISTLEIGWNSNIERALEMFPESSVQYIVSASFMLTASPEQVVKKFREILDKARGNLNRFSLAVADLEYGTPDENIRKGVHAVLNYS